MNFESARYQSQPGLQRLDYFHLLVSQSPSLQQQDILRIFMSNSFGHYFQICFHNLKNIISDRMQRDSIFPISIVYITLQNKNINHKCCAQMTSKIFQKYYDEQKCKVFLQFPNINSSEFTLKKTLSNFKKVNYTIVL